MRELRGVKLRHRGPERAQRLPKGAKFGAGNEVRTRDLDLGKVALYQLSYTRIRARIV